MIYNNYKGLLVKLQVKSQVTRYVLILFKFLNERQLNIRFTAYIGSRDIDEVGVIVGPAFSNPNVKLLFSNTYQRTLFVVDTRSCQFLWHNGEEEKRADFSKKTNQNKGKKCNST